MRQTEETTGESPDAPNIKSPFKTRLGRGSRTANQKHLTTETRTQVIRTTKRKGSRVIGFTTPEATTKTKEGMRWRNTGEGEGRGTKDDFTE